MSFNRPPDNREAKEFIMKKAHMMIVTAAVAALGLTTALNVTNANEAAGEEVKTVAWYVANIQDARAQNQACHDNPGIQASANCANSLHALEITFTGGN
ncbi:hypothetical protein A1342_17895 [Methylomonas methanica]|uniref:Uncharacterized protein n=2 Tax=Methylomonas TaxID=416 RepID=A0A126T2L9_9GAMM|nr:hypothetical protein JT25_007490 [Methylomonas denitrificans]OAI00771.1 hypothetical protein A1342_17895 [Methylomonas methanica]